MYKALFLLLAIVVLAVAPLLVNTASGVSSEIDRPELKVTRVSVHAANIYLVERDGKRLMIDAGNPGDEAAIEEMMRSVDFPPESVDFLILTHGHLDHAGTAAYFQSRFGIQIIGGSGDELMFSKGEQQPLCSTSPLAVAIDLGLRGKTYSLFEADILVDASYDLQQLGITGNLLPMPGHTTGTLLVSFDDVVFVGDLIRGDVYRPTVPTRHFFMCDLSGNDRDIRQLLTRKDLTHWFPGHFGPLTATDVASVWNQAPEG